MGQQKNNPRSAWYRNKYGGEIPQKQKTIIPLHKDGFFIKLLKWILR